MHHKMPTPFAVLRVLAGAEIDLVVVDDGRADDVVPRAAAAQLQDRVLGVDVELPEQLGLAVLALVGLEAVDPAVAAAEDHLRHAADDRDRGAGPLAVQDVLAGRVVGPIDLARVLVHRDEARRFRGGNHDVRLIHAVAGVDEQDVAPARHRATAHVVLRRAQLLHHVVRPDHVGLVLVVGRDDLEAPRAAGRPARG